MVDEAVADAYGVKTQALNQQVKRNIGKFGDRFAFQATQAEWRDLISQNVISKGGRGGRRKPPWLFTERGVWMAATVLKSEKAQEAARYLVDVFMEAQAAARIQANEAPNVIPAHIKAAPLLLRDGQAGKLQALLDRVLSSMIDEEPASAISTEATELITGAVESIKQRLAEPGLSNKLKAAEIEKALGELTAIQAKGARDTAITEYIQLAVHARKLRLLLEMERAMQTGQVESLLETLSDLGSLKDHPLS